MTYLTAAGTGLSGARNIGARKASADVVAFLDDDAVPTRDWLAHLLVPFADERVAAVTGRVVPVTLELTSEQLYAAHGGLDLGPLPRLVDSDTEHWFEICNFGGIGHGANIAVRRSAFDEWSGFHEALGLGTTIPGSEEHHACFQLVAAGHRIAYSPKAVIEHPYPGTMQGLEAAHLRTLTGFAGHVTLLLVEEPSYRGRMVRFLWGAVRGSSRPWRTSPSRGAARLVPPTGPSSR